MTEELERDGQEVSGDDASGTEQTEETRQPQVNLDDLPQFRQWKSNTDKRVAAYERQLQQAMQQLSQVEQQFHREKMEQLDDVGRLQYELALIRQENERLKREQQFVAWQALRNEDVSKVAKKMGLTVDELEQALPEQFDSFVLWDVATNLAEQKRQNRTAAVDKPGNQVVSGGGKPTGSQDYYQRLYDKAANEDYDVKKALEIQWEAEAKGYKLKL